MIFAHQASAMCLREHDGCIYLTLFIESEMSIRLATLASQPNFLVMVVREDACNTTFAATFFLRLISREPQA